MAVLAALALAACSSSSSDTSTPDVAPVTYEAAPHMDDSQAQRLLYDLGEIDDSMNYPNSIGRARSMCESILDAADGHPHPQYSLIELAKSRFSRGPLTDDQAQQVIDVITEAEWCTR